MTNRTRFGWTTQPLSERGRAARREHRSMDDAIAHAQARGVPMIIHYEDSDIGWHSMSLLHAVWQPGDHHRDLAWYTTEDQAVDTFGIRRARRSIRRGYAPGCL